MTSKNELGKLLEPIRMQLMPGNDWMAPKSGGGMLANPGEKRGIFRDALAVGIKNRSRLYGVLISLPSVRGELFFFSYFLFFKLLKYMYTSYAL